MVAETDIVEQFPSPDLRGARTLDTSGQWFREVCMWLQRSPSSPGTTIWPLILVPDVIDPRFRTSDDAVLIHHSVEWTGPVPSEPFDVSASVEWISTRGRSVEIGMSSSATVDGLEVARSVVIIRAEGEAVPFGTRVLPSRPGVGSVVRHRRFVIGQGEVQTFASFAGSAYRLHEDVHYAQERGFPNVLVQGVMLLISQLHYAGAPDAGKAEMWFEQAVPAGSLLELCRNEDDPDVWVLRFASREAAATARMVRRS